MSTKASQQNLRLSSQWKGDEQAFWGLLPSLQFRITKVSFCATNGQVVVGVVCVCSSVCVPVVPVWVCVYTCVSVYMCVRYEGADVCVYVYACV